MRGARTGDSGARGRAVGEGRWESGVRVKKEQNHILLSEKVRFSEFACMSLEASKLIQTYSLKNFYKKKKTRNPAT